MSIHPVTESVQRLFVETLQHGALAVVDEILTPDFRFGYPFPGFSAGREGVREFAKGFRTAFPGLEVEVNSLFGCHSDEDLVSVSIRWTARGDNTGEFFGNPPSGNYVSFSAIGEYTGGGDPPRVHEGWLELNSVSLFHQVGLMPSIQELLPGLPGLR